MDDAAPPAVEDDTLDDAPDEQATNSSSDTLGEEGYEELRRAVRQLKALSAENGTLKANFESLKALHVALQAQHAELGTRYAGLSDEKEKTEGYYQGLCRQWAERLAAKQAEFEAASTTIMNPHELQMMELRLREEIEAPYRAKCASLEREAEVLHSQAHAARHDLAIITARAEADGAAHAKLVSMLKVDYEARLGELREDLAGLQDAPSQVETLEVRLAEVSRELSAARAARAKADEECDALRDSLERAAPDVEAKTMAARADVQRAQAEESTMRRQLEAMGRRARNLQSELELAQKANAELQDRRLGEQAGWATTQAKLEEKVSSLEARCYALKESNGSLTAQLADAEARIDAAAAAERSSRKATEAMHRADLESARRASESVEEAAKSKLETERARWDARNLELQAALDAARAAAIASSRKAEEVSDTGAREAENLRRELSAAQADRRSAVAASERAAAAKAEADAERESLHRDVIRMQEMVAAAEERASEATAKLKDVEADRDRAAADAAEAAAQLSDAAEGAREARVSSERAVADAAAQARAEREAIIGRAEGLAEEARVREKATIKKANARLREQQSTIKALLEARENMRLQLGQTEAQVRALQEWQATVELGGAAASAHDALGPGSAKAAARGIRADKAPSLYDSPSQKLTRKLERLNERQSAYLKAKTKPVAA